MYRDDFEPFELNKLIEALELLVSSDNRDQDAKHILACLKNIKEEGETLTVKTNSNWEKLKPGSE